MQSPTPALPTLLLAALVLTPAPSAPAVSLTGGRPNIILVMTDDQGKGDLGCLGNPYIRTPNTDRLYLSSTRFTDFHVSPTCAPTRSAIMTGRHEFMNGVTHTILERERMTLHATTLAQVLRDAGYATGIFGKWHLGDEEPYQPHRRGFTEAFIHGAGGIGQKYDSSCADAPPNTEVEGRYFDNVIRHNGRFVKTRGFCTDVFFQAALGWIRKRKDSGQPFFVYLSTNAPHGPFIAPEKSKRRFLELGFEDAAAARMGMIENIDDNLGVLMNQLAVWGLEENTLLIFMTDNGSAGGVGRRAKRNGEVISVDFSGFQSGKGSTTEGGTSVPAFWRWRGVLPEGRDIDRLTAHIDLFPTFAALAGARLPGGNQVRGRSLVPLMENPEAPWPDRHLFVHRGRWAKGADPNLSKFDGCAVRTARFRLVNNRELYDISIDPFEEHDVIDDHPAAVAEMRAAYDAWWAEAVPLMVNETTPNSPARPF
jgi:arylsulfatase A-like enzyme